MLLVDEVDMAADDDLGWDGAEHFTAARFFYGCTASDLTIKDKNALKWPGDGIYKVVGEGAFGGTQSTSV